MAEPELYSNRYEILRHVARGGMAEVYLARDHLLDRPVALKVLFPEYARDEAFVERFRREAKAAAQLNHPNIVAVYDWGEEGGTYFIVMEYVEGQSLRDMVMSDGSLLPERAAEITADIAAALGFAHRHGVVHRDVKPGNVLITNQGQVKVTDFGIARGRESGALTRTGMVMGTATYFSPEQAQGLDVDPRSDVYSLGIVLYEMSVGEPPFSGDDAVAIAYQHVREEPAPPSVRNLDVPVDLERIILTSLSKTPADRYPSAEDMRSDLVRFTRGLPVSARPVTAMVAEYADETAVAQRVPSDSTQVIERTAEGGGPPPYEPPDRGRRMTAYIATLIALLLVVAGLLYLLARSLGVIGGASTVVVPEVAGMELSQAREELEALGLEVDPEFVENPDVPENRVFAQDPEAGARADDGSVVVLQVSQGAGTARVPDVVDRTLEDARTRVEDAGFDVRVVEEFSDEVDEGRVIRTSPEAGEEEELGADVTLVVSSGSEPITIPDVVGLTAVEASQQLGAAGFDVESENEPSDTVEEGRVIRTEPPATTEAERDSTVTIYVSSGVAQVEVPGVVGLEAGEASAEIEEAGLNTAENVTNECEESQDGTVLSQNPSEGTQVEPGSTVTITVCEYVPPDDGEGGGPGGEGPPGL